MEREFNEIIKLKNSKILHYLELIRIWNSFTPAILVGLGGLLAGTISISLILLAFIFMLMYFGATTLNDLFDFEADKINSPYRPLHTKKISLLEAKIITLFTYSLALLLGAIFFEEIFILIFITVLLSLLYSAPPFSLKDKLFIGIINLSFLTVFLPIYSGFFYITKNVDLNTLGFIFCLTLTFMFVALLKDLKDLSGDIIAHKRTFALRFGKQKTSYFSLFGFVLFFSITMYFFSIIISNLIVPIIIAFLAILQIYKIEKQIPHKNQYSSENSFSEARLTILIIVLIIMITLLIL